ncbi:glucose-6-phosphate dehydrogenase [Pseudoclavibacter sp. AY1F1]|uniref:glucose-6-phosphate dehydrogenase n=1 Tax=Pseudoclavibacter sp. AY1F1 TaxID=2080583 RepID=UPI0015E2CA5C|nr:glucose-6-phosphate dehydrogenase [Pseudoclavibacter sp. AY1F1]
MRTTVNIPEVAIDGRVARTIAILGAGGDLTERFLLPGIARVVDASPEVEVHVIGAARTAQSRDEWRGVVERSLEGAGVSQATIDGLVSRSEFVQTDASSADELRELLEECPSSPLLYIALPPAMGRKVAAALAELELPDDLRIAIEKPFGENEADARELNRALAEVIPEERLWRIDHFLGTPTAVELIRSRELIEQSGVVRPHAAGEHGGAGPGPHAGPGRVEIIFEEELGIEGRGAFYDETGALRDMLQSHLLLILALAAMEHPGEHAGAVGDAVAEVLRAVKVWDDSPVSARRARYTAGEVGGKRLPAYVDEEDVDVARNTETLAEITLRVDTPRWRDVPFVLRSAKGIGGARQEMILTPGDDGTPPTRIQLRAPAGDNSADPYARVIAGMLAGNTLLSVRGDVAEELWRIVTPVLDAWEQDTKGDTKGLDEYAAGTRGSEV